MKVQKVIELLQKADPELQVFLDGDGTEVSKMLNSIECLIGDNGSGEFYPVLKSSNGDKKKVLVLTHMTKRDFKLSSE